MVQMLRRMANSTRVPETCGSFKDQILLHRMWHKSQIFLLEVLPQLRRKILINIKKDDSMKKYKFVSKRSKEAIGLTEAYTISEAVIFFASLKKLPIDTFLEIYEVSEVK